MFWKLPAPPVLVAVLVTVPFSVTVYCFVAPLRLNEIVPPCVLGLVQLSPLILMLGLSGLSQLPWKALLSSVFEFVCVTPLDHLPVTVNVLCTGSLTNSLAV